MATVKELEAQVEDLQAKLEAAELRAEAAAAAKGGFPAPKKKVYETTEAGSHVANYRGYLGGVVIEPGEAIPAGHPVSTEWMRKADEPAPEDADDDNKKK